MNRTEEKKLYYELNKERIRIKQKEYYETVKEDLKLTRSEYHKSYRNANKDKAKEYYLNNKNKLNKRSVTYITNRLKTDSIFKFSENIKKLIRISFKSNGCNKSTRTTNILGCSIPEFKAYIESKFQPWMSWDNHGLYNGESEYGWDIDHITPISSAITEEDIIRLNHYTNLQPLCSYTNRVLKRNKLIPFP
jgi:hypothetical protein